MLLGTSDISESSRLPEPSNNVTSTLVCQSYTLCLVQMGEQRDRARELFGLQNGFNDAGTCGREGGGGSSLACGTQSIKSLLWA